MARRLSPSAPRATDLVSLHDGAAALVSGPVLTNKRALVVSLLAARASAPRADGESAAGSGLGTDTDTGTGDGRAGAPGTVLVTTRKPATTVAREFRDAAGDAGGPLAIVDCTGVDAGTRRTAGGRSRRYVSGPGDLTGVGIGLTGFVRRLHDATDAGGGAVGLHSLSTMLMYADLKRVFQFVHVVTGQLAAVDFPSVFALDDGVLAERESSILRQPFDATIEVRPADDDPAELRTRGDVSGPREWTAFGW